MRANFFILTRLDRRELNPTANENEGKSYYGFLVEIWCYSLSGEKTSMASKTTCISSPAATPGISPVEKTLKVV